MADRYAIERTLGSGGMADVYLAHPDNPGWTRPRSYDVTPDGERFLMTRRTGEHPLPRVVVVLDWFEELCARRNRPLTALPDASTIQQTFTGTRPQSRGRTTRRLTGEP